MFSNNVGTTPDPLGLGLRQRAYAAQRAFEDENREVGKQHGQLVSFSNLGPLKDPMWAAYQQALSERGVGKLVGGSLPMSRFNESTEVVGGPFSASPAGPSQYAARSLYRGTR